MAQCETSWWVDNIAILEPDDAELSEVCNESLTNHVLSSTDRLNPACQAQRA